MLQECVKTFEGQFAKDSHNSNLPPSSDRFACPAKSLKQKSGKKPGGQRGHRGHHLKLVEAPDEWSFIPFLSVNIASETSATCQQNCQSGDR